MKFHLNNDYHSITIGYCNNKTEDEVLAVCHIPDHVDSELVDVEVEYKENNEVVLTIKPAKECNC